MHRLQSQVYIYIFFFYLICQVYFVSFIVRACDWRYGKEEFVWVKALKLEK